MDLVLSILVLAAIALLLGAAYLWQRGERQRPLLMLVLAVIMAANVAIWTLPTKGGEAPLDKVEPR